MAPLEPPSKPMGIIGMAYRLPGGISTDSDYWDLLVNKKNGKCRVPPTRYNVDAFSGTQVQSVASEYGYFLDADLGGADASFFTMKHAELDLIDPQLKLLLEVVWECTESAGQTHKLEGSRTGVFAGVFGEDWHNMLHRDDLMMNNYRVVSAGDYTLSNIISYQYDLKGPSMTVRTACSSSLSALHIACQAIRNGDCAQAVVLGSSLIIDPSMTLDMAVQGVLASDGCCKTFDAAADGFARGEAISALLIKPLENAVNDGDPIRAVIRSTALNSDGKTSHMGTPSPESQTALIKHAYETAGIEDLTQTPFVECHGTGTMKGDPIETAAVGAAFGDRGTYIGSVKPNLGHGEGAAALTSIIKCVLALENKTIPPNINFSKPNPKIPFEKFNLQVPVEPIPWPEDRSERISINAFGFGGANGHVIIDSAASFGIVAPRSIPSTSPSRGSSSPDNKSLDEILANSGDELSDSPTTSVSSRDSGDAPVLLNDNGPLRILPVSAHSEQAAKDRIGNVQEYLAARPLLLDDVVYTLGARSKYMLYRAYGVYDALGALIEFSAPKKLPATKGQKKIVFVFTGQGAQWRGMARELVSCPGMFLDDIRQMDQILQSLTSPPEWTLEALLADKGIGKRSLDDADISQPACTAVQIALVNWLSRCGVIPGAVIGHSSGEIAAAYAAGILNMCEALLTAFFRGLATVRRSIPGSMAAVGLGREGVTPFLVEGVQIACDNGPKSVTISGSADAVDKTIELIRARDGETFVRKLKVSVAYHSAHMKAVGESYADMLKPHLGIKHSVDSSSCAFYSSLLGRLADTEVDFDWSYWRDNLACPVLFFQAMQCLVDDLGDVAIIEVGPHPALQGPVRQILQAGPWDASEAYVSTLVRGKPAQETLLHTIGQLHCMGHAVDFSAVNPPGSLLIDLPRYPWDRKTDSWRESRLSLEWRMRKFRHHELLGTRCMEASGVNTTWRNLLHQYNLPWLKDHRLGEDIVFPATGYMAMMGEAIRQLVGALGYVLEDFVVKAAMVVPENAAIEMMTTVKPFRLTNLCNSPTWFEFSISTYASSCWVEHAVARGRAWTDRDSGCDTSELGVPRPRRVEAGYIYNSLQYIGLVYGDAFRGLSNISTETSDCRAVASIRHGEQQNHEPWYAVHPTTIDCCIQLAGVASYKGLGKNMSFLAVPVDVGYVAIRPGGPDLVCDATTDTHDNTSYIVAVDKATNEAVVEIRNGRCMPFNNGGIETGEMMHSARLQWLPDISSNVSPALTRTDFPFRQCSELMNTLAVESMVRMWAVLQNLGMSQSSVPEHLRRYFVWLGRQSNRLLTDEIVYGWETPESKIVLRQGESMSSSQWDCRFQALRSDIEAVGGPEVMGMADLLYRLCQPDTVDAMFMDTIKPLQICLEDDGLASFYNLSRQPVSGRDYIGLCAHARPTLQVLEIGAGVGATTEVVLPWLLAENGVRMYSRYVFSDISSGFFVGAKDKFASWDAIDYKLLDIEKDAAEQGFDLASFDLIIASNVLHVTSSLHNSLTNVRSLLKPGGRLYLHELVGPSSPPAIECIAGLLPGWWSSRDDDRPDTPIISVERWNRELLAAGFSGTENVLVDEDYPYSTCALMTSTAVFEAANPASSITFLYKDVKNEFGCRLAAVMESNGQRVQWMRLGDPVQEDPDQQNDIISIVELEGPFFDDISEHDHTNFMKLLSRHRKGIMWLTRPAQVLCTDPGYGAAMGFLRAVRTELGIDCWLVEVQNLDDGACFDAAHRLGAKFYQREPLSRSVDSEYVIRDGVVYIGRFRWFSLHKELQSPARDEPVKQLIIGKYGSLESLHWETVADYPDLGPDDVEVEIRCVGINFRDVLVTMGIVHGAEDSLGIECSGVIIRKGAGVDSLKIGDEVLTMGSGCFMTRKLVPSSLVVKIPKGLTLEEGVTLPVVYATAIYALVTLGRLKKGQSVLIHSAAGGVGQAAMNICKAIGAEIYVTVGNDEKVKFVMEEYGIPRDRIFHSRNDSFLNDVLASTNDRGVDMVLNSLAGDLLQASWRCVAKFGKMLEIGKRDMLEHGRLAMDMFQGNRSFFGIELSAMPPQDILAIMKDGLLSEYSTALKPIKPIHTFGADQVMESFKYMKKGQHIGKIVIVMPSDRSTLSTTLSSAARLFSRTSTYLIVGGLGGLGKEVARWMVEHGAARICFMSPSAASDKHKPFIRELESQGCQITAASADVSKLEDVQRVISESSTPIAGVVQLSMVLRDRGILDITYDDWRAVLAPKVKGTWNLHNAFLQSNTKLDFFILTGSIAGLLGQPGQANYACANSFLDSFSQYRQGLGLPCSVIDLGGMEGVGFLADKPQKMNQFKSSGMYLMQERQLLEAIQVGLQRSPVAPTGMQPASHGLGFMSMSQVAVGLASHEASSVPLNMAFFQEDIKFHMYINLVAVDTQMQEDRDNGLKNLLAQLEADPTLLDAPDIVERVAWEVGKTLFKYLSLPEEDLDIHHSLESIGVDSLVSIEIRNWWRRSMGLETTALEIMNCGTIEGLAKMGIPGLKKKYAQNKAHKEEIKQ